MDLVVYIAFFLFGLYLAGRLMVRFRVMSDVPWWVGDPIHGAVGVFITRLPVEWAWLVAVLYVTYQVLDWKLNNSNPVKDMATFMSGVLIGLGFDVVRF